jgi:hypothetical protein
LASSISPDLLSPLQQRILDAVARGLEGVFLSGGTALGAVYLGHRQSVDLDLFTREPASFEGIVRGFQRLMTGEGLSLTPGHAGPGFRRFVVSDGAAEVPVDLVVDGAPAIGQPLVLANGLAIDSLEDIAANKLCAILGRAEVRDYVDLFFLARRGVDLVALVAAAQRKDGAADPATLAFVLSEVRVQRPPTGLSTPVSVAELQAFIDDLRQRLARAAFPRESQ